MQIAILIMYPGMYILGALFFIVTFVILKPKQKANPDADADDSLVFASTDKMMSNDILSNVSKQSEANENGDVVCKL